MIDGSTNWQVLCVPAKDAAGSVSVSAKISDFGLALRAMPLASGRGWGSVWTPPRGTPLYMAPEMFVQQDARGCVKVRNVPETPDFVAVQVFVLMKTRERGTSIASCDHASPRRASSASCTGLPNGGRVQLWGAFGVSLYGQTQPRGAT